MRRTLTPAHALLAAGLLWTWTGCYSPPPPPDDESAPAQRVITADADGDTETPDAEEATAAPLCPGDQPCDVHCFVELPWNDNEFTALMCKEVLGAEPATAAEMAAQLCLGALSTAEGEGGVALGPCPLTATIEAQTASPTGWAPMQQMAGCRLEVQGEPVVHKWLYELALAVSDFTGDQGAPSTREVETYCVDLSDAATQSTTVLQCVPEGCQGDACVPEICLDGDATPCSALVCRAAADGSLCDFELDHDRCDDEASCTQDTCTPQGCTFEADVSVCPTIACREATCDPTQDGADESGCAYASLDEGTPCTDSDPCTLEDVCVDGDCVGTAMECTGGSATCAAQSCSGGLCVAQPINPSAECTDGVGCFDLFQCSGGACIGVGSQTDCDDDQPCTFDACLNGVCSNESLIDSDCDDGDPCTITDQCDATATCVGVPKVCDNGDPCMAGQCNPENGQCVFTQVPECDCCLVHDSPGCAEGETTGCVCPEWSSNCVCSHEPTCCTEAWTEECVFLVGLCGEEVACESMECGDGVCANLETYLTCPLDCASCEVDSECNDWNPCTNDVCEQTPTAKKTCVNKTEALEGTACHDADPCITEAACTEGFCDGLDVQSATCDGSCAAEPSAPVSLTGRAHAIDMRLLGEPGNTPSGAVLFVVEEAGLRRFSYLAPNGGEPPAFKDPEEVVPWMGKFTPHTLLTAGPNLAASVAFAASQDGIELLHVGAYELPPTPLDYHGSTIEPDAMALDELGKRLVAVGAGGMEILSVLNNVLEPILHLPTDEIAAMLDVPVGRLVDVAIRDQILYLLDEEAGLLAIQDGGPGQLALVSMIPTPELFLDGVLHHPRALVLGDDGLHVLSVNPDVAASYRLSGVAVIDTLEMQVAWEISLEGHGEILDITRGPCGGVTVALGAEGLGWLPVPSTTDVMPAIDGPMEGQLLVRDVGFPVEAAVAADQCNSTGVGTSWVAVAGSRGGAGITQAVINTPGQIQEFELLGSRARTGLASQVAVLEGEADTLAFVADGQGMLAVDGAKQLYKGGIRLYDVSQISEPKLLETCPFGDGAGRVPEVISDGLGRVHALVAEGEWSVLLSMADPEGASLCNLCPACKVLLRPVQDGSLWMEPLASTIYPTVDKTELLMDLFVIGQGEAWLQGIDVTRHADAAEVWLALSEGHFPEGVEGLSALAIHRGEAAHTLYLGVLGPHPGLLALDVDNLFGAYPELPQEPVEPRSTLAPSDPSYSGRPMAITVSDSGMLYAVLDDMDELHHGADCETCVDSRLWIVDVSDPEAPDEKYLSGLVPSPGAGVPTGDLGNASDLRLVGDQLFIASRQRGLLIVDVSNPAVPVLVSETPVEGQVSGLAMTPEGVLMAAGSSPLSVIETHCTAE